jgi:hypothetical protein
VRSRKGRTLSAGQSRLEYHRKKRGNTARPSAAKHEILNPKSQAVVESSQAAKILKVSSTDRTKACATRCAFLASGRPETILDWPGG